MSDIKIPEFGLFTIVAAYTGGLDTEKDKVLLNILGSRDVGSGLNLITGDRDCSPELGVEIVKDLQNVKGFEVHITVYPDPPREIIFL